MIKSKNKLPNNFVIIPHVFGKKIHDVNFREFKIHPDYDIICIIKGTFAVEVNGKKFVLQEGDFALFYPDVVYLTYTEDSMCLLVYMHFDCIFDENSRALSGYNFAGVLRTPNMKAEQSIAISSWINYVRRSSVSTIMREGVIKVILSRFISAKPADLTLFHRNTSHKPFSESQLFVPVFRYINDHIDEDISNAVLASLIPCSEKYFIRIFSEQFGQTPYNYIKSLRLSLSKNYLFHNQYTLSDIAAMFGYTSTNAFSKAFKKEYHINPSDFRKQIHSNKSF